MILAARLMGFMLPEQLDGKEWAGHLCMGPLGDRLRLRVRPAARSYTGES